MNYCLAAGTMVLAVVGQIVPSEPMAWLSNVGGLGLATLLCLRTIPAMSKDNKDAQQAQTKALVALTAAITELRVHCAEQVGKPADDK